MSLILDAIKKSERERQQQEVPNLSANHNDYQRSTKPYKWIGLIVIVLLLGISFFVYSWLTKKSLKVNSEPSTETHLVSGIKTPAGIIEKKSSETKSKIMEQKNNFKKKQGSSINRSENKQSSLLHEEKNKLLPSKNASTNTSKNTSFITQKPTISKKQPMVQESSNKKIIAIESLPQSILANVPDLIYSSHIFTGDGSTSFIVINKKITGEGEKISNHITVEQINELDVILTIDGRKVRLDKLKSWHGK